MLPGLSTEGWDLARDIRDDDQVKRDYIFGKKNEMIVFNNLPYPKYIINYNDEFKKLSQYAPDAFIRRAGYWRPAEIKFTFVNLKWIELKENQAHDLAAIDGLYLQAKPFGFAIVEVAPLVRDAIPIEKGYCNKPCYRIEHPVWKPWGRRITFVQKNTP